MKKRTQKQITGYIAIIAGAGVAVAICMVLILSSLLGGLSGTIYADIVIQNYGTITVKLEPEMAPITVKNFVKLAESGFYDGLTFHRIIQGFMMQGGDPKADGSGGSGETIQGEFIVNGVENTLKHTAGAISMARSKGYNTASSQFFIVHQDSSYLDGNYAVFGYVVEGMEIVDAICKAAKPIDDNGSIPKKDQPIIETITIRRSIFL